MRPAAGLDLALLSRIEDAGLNASAPPQQRWLDGWLVRFNAGKAQRARCINAIAPGRRGVAEKLDECRALYRQLGLPCLVRVTLFSQPTELDRELHALGYAPHDETRVMWRPPAPAAGRELPADLVWEPADSDALAAVAAALRGSPESERAVHAQRLRESPVPYQGYVIRRRGEGTPLACGQIACEGPLAGLYDVVTAPASRRQGLATLLCERLLTVAERAGSPVGYLQVGADNEAARRIYARLGYVDAYGYHYRVAPADA